MTDLLIDVETREIRRYGWKPSLPDPRDLQADTAELGLAIEVDPRPEMPPIWNQAQLGSCTAHAVVAAILYDLMLDGHDWGMPSRLALYWFERFIEGGLPQTQQDTGAYGRDGFKVAQKIGLALEEHWPYVVGDFAKDPRHPLSAELMVRKLTKPYKAVPRAINQFKAVLSNRQTIAFGFSVFESFESDEVARTGIVPVPQRGERMLGGHEVQVVGYLEDEPHYALCRNSWDVDWGIGGYFLMPWTILLDPAMSSDFRTIYRPKGT